MLQSTEIIHLFTRLESVVLLGLVPVHVLNLTITLVLKINPETCDKIKKYFTGISSLIFGVYKVLCCFWQHPQIQKKTSKFIRYLCAENKAALDQWIMGIRIAKVTGHCGCNISVKFLCPQPHGEGHLELLLYICDFDGNFHNGGGIRVHWAHF